MEGGVPDLQLCVDPLRTRLPLHDDRDDRGEPEEARQERDQEVQEGAKGHVHESPSRDSCHEERQSKQEFEEIASLLTQNVVVPNQENEQEQDFDTQVSAPADLAEDNSDFQIENEMMQGASSSGGDQAVSVRILDSVHFLNLTHELFSRQTLWRQPRPTLH